MGQVEKLKQLRAEFFALCEDTEDKYQAVGQRDLEGKEGAFARGRCFEAKSLRREMGERFSAAIRDLEMSGIQ